MQLVVVLALLMMFGGKNSSTNRPQISGAEMAEIFKYISGDNGEMNKIIEEVEQVSEIINTLAPVVSAFGGAKADNTPFDWSDNKASGNDIKIPGYAATAPIANIADDSIYNALSRAIS